mgnify:CR=1 FL=1
MVAIFISKDSVAFMNRYKYYDSDRRPVFQSAHQTMVEDTKHYAKVDPATAIEFATACVGTVIEFGTR